MNKPQVLLVDDEALVRQAVAGLLTASGCIDVVAQISDPEQLLERVQKLKVDAILLKADLGRCDSIRLVRSTKRLVPLSRFILIADRRWENQSGIEAAIEAGVRAILSRSIEPQDLLACIRIVVNGGLIFATPCSSAVMERLSSSLELNQADPSVWDNRAIPMALEDTGLSEREFDVLTLLAEGASNRQIAELLSITENTAKTHVRNILEKLQLHSRTHAAAYAIRRGFVRRATEEEDESPPAKAAAGPK